MTRGKSARYVPAFRLALDQKLRPTATLFRDPYFGHRNSFTGRPDGNANDWTSWDFALGTAMQAIQDGTTEEGHLIWELEQYNVDARPIKRIDKHRRAVDDATGGDKYKADPGEYWITELYQIGVEPGEEKWQTRSEWVESLNKKQQAQ